MADKKRQVVVELSLDTKDAKKNIAEVIKNLGTMVDDVGKYGDFSYFTTLLDYLAQIEDKLNELQKQDPIAFEEIFGKNAATFIDSITKSASSLLETPKILEQVVSKIASMDFSGNAEEAREAIELLVNVYQRLGLEVPKVFDGYESWDTSTLRSKVDDIKKAATDLSGIDWAKAFKVEVPGSIEEQAKELEKQLTNLQRVKTRWVNKIADMDEGIVPKGMEQSTQEELDEYYTSLEEKVTKIDSQMEALFSKKYTLSPGSIFQDFNDAVTKAFDFDLDTEEQAFQAQLNKMQAMVNACRENIDDDLANELQGVLNSIKTYGFHPDTVDTSAVQKSMEAIIEKYQKTKEAANDTKQTVVSTNDEINNSFNSGDGGSGSGTVTQEKYDELKKKLDEVTESAKQMREQLNNSGGTNEEFTQLSTALEKAESNLRSLQEEFSELGKSSVSTDVYDEIAEKLRKAEDEVQELRTKLENLSSGPGTNGLQQGLEGVADAAGNAADKTKQAGDEIQASFSGTNTSGMDKTQQELEETGQAAKETAEQTKQASTDINNSLQSFGSGSGGGGSPPSDIFEQILAAIKEITTAIEPFTSALKNSETALGQMATEGGASIQTLVGQLETLGKTLDEISQKSLGINIFQKANGSGGTNLAAYKESLLSLQDPLTQIIRLAQTVSGSNGAIAQAAIGISDAIGNLSNVKSKAAIENNANELQHWYNVLVQIIEASGKAEQVNFEKIKFPTVADFSTDATDRFLQSITDINTQSQATATETTQNFTELIAVLEKLSTTLDNVVKTFEGLKLNISTEELGQSLEKIKQLEQEVADLKQQLQNVGTGADTSNIESAVKKISSLLDLDALKTKAKDAGVFDALTEEFKNFEDVLHNTDLTDEQAVEKAVTLYRQLNDQIDQLAQSAKNDHSMREQIQQTVSLANSLKTAFNLMGNADGYNEIKSLLKELQNSAGTDDVYNTISKIVNLFQSSGLSEGALEFAKALASYQQTVSEFQKLTLDDGSSLFDSSRFEQFYDTMQSAIGLIATGNTEQFNAMIKTLQEMVNQLQKEATAAYQAQDNAGYEALTQTSVDILEQHRAAVKKTAEEYQKLYTEMGNTEAANRVQAALDGINSATNDTQLQKYRNELRAIKQEFNFSSKDLTLVDESTLTNMDNVVERLKVIRDRSEETADELQNQFDGITTSGGLNAFFESLEAKEKELGITAEDVGKQISETFSSLDSTVLNGSLTQTKTNVFQWIETDAQDMLVEVTATINKLGQIEITKNPIEDIFSSNYSSKWLKNIQSEMTNVINGITKTTQKLAGMDYGSQQYKETEEQIVSLQARLKDLQNQLENSDSIGAGKITDSMNKAFSDFGRTATGQIDAVKKSFDGLDTESKDVQAAFSKLGLSVADVENDIKAMDKAFDDFKNAKTFDEQTKAAKELADAISKTTTEVKGIQTELKSTNAATSDFIKSAGKMALQLAGLDTTYEVFQKIVQVIREGVEVVTELDSAMAQLKIVTGATDSEMTQFLEESISLAKELGQSVSDVLESITTFSRLGYDLEESSTLSEFAGILSNVADVELEDATEGLTSVIKGFGLDVEDVEHVSDVLITVGNNYAISASEILTAMTKSSAALDASNTSFEKSVALVAAANSAVQDASTVGTALKTKDCLYVQKCA